MLIISTFYKSIFDVYNQPSLLESRGGELRWCWCLYNISWALIHDLPCWKRIMRMKTKHWRSRGLTDERKIGSNCLVKQWCGERRNNISQNNIIVLGTYTMCTVGSQPFPRVSNYYQNSFELRKQYGFSFFFWFFLLCHNIII